MRALIVDDEELARRRLARMIAEVDGVVVVGEAADGIEALERVAELRPDVVFLDSYRKAELMGSGAGVTDGRGASGGRANWSAGSFTRSSA